MTCILLFINFARIAICSFGGGSATIPYLMELPGRYDWVTVEQLAGIIAVGESAPGPGGVNMASYIGFEAAGVPGVLSAVAGLCLPSIILVTILATCLKEAQKHRVMKCFIYGIRPAVVSAIAVAVIGLMELTLLINAALCWRAIAVYVLGMGVTHWKMLKRVPLIVWIIASGLLGVILKM